MLVEIILEHTNHQKGELDEESSASNRFHTVISVTNDVTINHPTSLMNINPNDTYDLVRQIKLLISNTTVNFNLPSHHY